MFFYDIKDVSEGIGTCGGSNSYGDLDCLPSHIRFKIEL